jgi:hypothetical protein
MRRTIIFALAAPVLVWLGFIVIGKKKPDVAATGAFMDRGFFLNIEHGLAVEAAAAGALVAYLTKKGAA